MSQQSTLPEDSELIKRLIANDQAAYLMVVKNYHSLMLQIARGIIGEAFAEEVVQEAWLSMAKGLPNFEQRSSFKTWLLRIVANGAKSRLRKEARHTNLGEHTIEDTPLLAPERFDQRGHWSQPPREWDSEDPETLLTSEQLDDCLDKTVDMLPDNQQNVLLMRDKQDMEIDDICKILELSESNTRVLLHRARTRIRNMIERFQEDGTC